MMNAKRGAHVERQAAEPVGEYTELTDGGGTTGGNGGQSRGGVHRLRLYRSRPGRVTLAPRAA
jgi:hypothetical protein